MNSFHLINALDSMANEIEIKIEAGCLVESFGGDSKPTVIDAKGLTVIPGLVDLHTHLREPGREDAETVLTGALAAVAGGYTAISAMPNTLPVADTAGVVEQVKLEM